MQRIDVYDINLNRIGALFTWVSLIWEHGYNTLGAFQLEVQQTEQAAKLLKPWQYYKIDTDDKPMLALSMVVKDKKIVLNGFPATILLDRRVSDIEVRNTLAEKAMFQLVGDMKPWENVSTGEYKGIQAKFENQVSNRSILEYCQVIGQAADIGFYIRKDSKDLLFECYKPELNPNLKFSERYGNLADIVLTLSDTKHYNVCIVAGMAIDSEIISKYKEYYSNISFETNVSSMTATVTYDNISKPNITLDSNMNLVWQVDDPEEDILNILYWLDSFSNINVQIVDRVTVEVGETESQGYLRREMYVDARDVQQEEAETFEHYLERLRQRGLEKLAESLQIETVEFGIDDDRAKLGDLVSVNIPEFGMQLITRIVTDKYKSQGNRIIRTISVGTPLSILRS